MTAAVLGLLEELSARGMSVELVDGKPVLRGAQRFTALEYLPRLAALRQQIVAYLQAPPLTDAQLDAIADRAWHDPPEDAVSLRAECLLEIEPGRWLAVDPATVDRVRQHNAAARERFLRDNPGW